MKKDEFVQRILTPIEGAFLYNEKEDVISSQVYLGRDASEADWVEITEARKLEIETAREEKNKKAEM